MRDQPADNPIPMWFDLKSRYKKVFQNAMIERDCVVTVLR